MQDAVTIEEFMRDILAVVGFCTIIGTIISVILYILLKIFQKCKYLVMKFRSFFRFKGHPIAKCYCRDCEYYGTPANKHQCLHFTDWETEPNWFCWAALPKRDPKIFENGLKRRKEDDSIE